jgi:hypothetical protein
MEIKSPIGNLIENLRKAKNFAIIYQDKLSKSEASTRSSLIDPILLSLGWDLTNPNMIEFEKTYPKSRVDYALVNQENKIQVIIEAKSLGGNLNEQGIVLNLIMYALASGVKNVFLTDGVIWEHYTDYSPGNVVSSKTIDITKDNLLDCANYFIENLDAARYWSTDVPLEGQVNEQFSKQILDLRNEISNLRYSLELLQQITEKKPTKEQINKIVEPKVFDELKSLELNLAGKKPPLSLRLPDGNEKEIKRWRDILTECCKFVMDKNSKIPIPLPDAAGKKVRLLDTVPPGKGIANHTYNYNGQTIYIYTNYDANHCVINALYILQFLDHSMKKFAVGIRY